MLNILVELLSFKQSDMASALDWSEPVVKESNELVLSWDDDPADVDMDDESPPMSMKLDKKNVTEDVDKDGKGFFTFLL